MSTLNELPDEVILGILKNVNNLDSLYRVSYRFQSLVSIEVIKRYKKFKYRINSLLEDVDYSKVEKMLFDLYHLIEIDKELVVFKSNNMLHREHGPAMLEWHENGKKRAKKWYIKEEPHRENGPAIVKWHRSGGKEYEMWCFEGKLHREDGPAVIEWDENGNKKSEKWHINWRLHREDGPAVIEWDENGNKKSEKWYIRGILHKENSPAVINWMKKSKCGTIFAKD